MSAIFCRLFFGKVRSFDQTVCVGLEVMEDEIEALCRKLSTVAKEHCRSEEEQRRVKDVTKNNLVSWGVLVEKDGKLLPTNAFALLTGNAALPTKVQWFSCICACLSISAAAFRG